MVLSIGETVEEVNNSGFIQNVNSILVSLIGDNILMQVYSRGIRLIQDKGNKEWIPPSNKKILKAGCNNQQVVIALTGGEIAYFELDDNNNVEEICRTDMKKEIIDVTVAPIPTGMKRSLWMAVACADNTVRILSLSKDSPLEQKSMQMLTGFQSSNDVNINANLSAKPNTVLLQYLNTSADVHSLKLFLFVGMYIGTLIRLSVDVHGHMSNRRERLLGTKPVTLFRTEIRNQPSVIALSTRTWITYTHQSRLFLAPLSYEHLEYVSYFSSEQCQEGMVSIAKRTLRIFTLERYGEIFNQTIYPLRYTVQYLFYDFISDSFF